MASTITGVFLFFSSTYIIIAIALYKPREKKQISSKENKILHNSLLTTRANQTTNLVFFKKNGGLIAVRGEGAHMYDENDVSYLDCCNNVACVGHSHPVVVNAGCAELGRIQTNARFLHPTQQRYLSKLLATFPPELDTVFLVNSGSEANDLALRIAKQHSTAVKKNDVICLDHAYHGHTAALIDISPYKWYQAIDGVNRQPESTHLVSCPDSYRGRYRMSGGKDVKTSEEVGVLYAKEIEDVVEKTGGVGVFIAESVVGCGGQIIPPKGYLSRCYNAVRGAGGVCIADEVQTGFGRAGSSFWAFQQHNVVPDIVTLGKPMGNGYPVAAVVCRRELADSFSKTGIEYFNTYGGNSVACAIAEAVLDTIHTEKLQDNSLIVGQYLLVKLKVLAEKYDWIGDVRGMGLFIGIEFIKSKTNNNDKNDLGNSKNKKSINNSDDLQPHTKLCEFLVATMMTERVLVSSDGPDNNVIKIKPPLVFSMKNADNLVEILEKGLNLAIAAETF